ncbi:MAG: beta-ketoacyl synthase chain length factor [Agarilytica sp.]
MKPVYIDAIAISTPGLDTWETARKVLKGELIFEAAPIERYKPKLLPANERRRATDLIRLAFKVSEEVIGDNLSEDQKLASVFASSGGDYQILDQTSKALALPGRIVSPTQFHNSVHNSAAGYWGIATGSREASTSISAFDYSFFAGLIEAATQVGHSAKSIQLTAYDTSPPEPLQKKRPILVSFACAFILSPEATDASIAKLDLRLNHDASSETAMREPKLEILRKANPAARSLPILEAIANQRSELVHIKGMGSQILSIEITAC